MEKYYRFFKIRFSTGIQYRMASVTALITQLLWGLMECLAYRAVAEASGGNLPMNYSSIVTYIWLKEASLSLFSTWAADNDLFAIITNGDIAYELCRPVSIYSMWFARTVGARSAEAVMRGIPILICAFFMPETCRMTLSANPSALFFFSLTLILAFGITVTFCMLVYMLCFFYHFTTGMENGTDGSGRFPFGEYNPSAFFSSKVSGAGRIISLCLYAECSISDIQRRTCRYRNIFMYFETDLLAGGVNAFGDCCLETGGKEDYFTGRLMQ